MIQRYLNGLGNEHQSEAVPNALPQGQNSPQKGPHGLYAEQINNTAFTAPRAENLRTWTYRIRPSVSHEGPFEPLNAPHLSHKNFDNFLTPPTQFRWDPLPEAAPKTHFIEGLHCLCANGSPLAGTGAAIYLYACNKSMTDSYFYSADGEMILVPWEGSLLVKTELGCLELTPGFIGMIPRGIKFQVILKSPSARGYVCENFGRHFRLPELGPIGANGLANRRDFEIPTAQFEEREGNFELIAKFGGQTFHAPLKRSPLDVVAWHGTLAPFRYDLFKFNVMGSISYDHPDPSIFTVLTSPSDTAGTANMDFVAFAPRWLVMENSFRPPYYHRNIMSEFMGLVTGEYDAKIAGGFTPGASSLHNCMSAHGPDREAFEKATAQNLQPQKLDSTMAFMLESRYIWQTSDWALKTFAPQKDYRDCWDNLPKLFSL